MRNIKALIGNFIYRLTGSNAWVDEEWNKNFHKAPNKKDWKMLLLLFLILLMVYIAFFVYNLIAV